VSDYAEEATMTRTRKEQTGTITVRRDDDGAEFQLQVISTFREIRDGAGVRVVEDRLKDVASADGRGVYTTDETRFFFANEPARRLPATR
jgi:hypothetical protein